MLQEMIQLHTSNNGWILDYQGPSLLHGRFCITLCNIFDLKKGIPLQLMSTLDGNHHFKNVSSTINEPRPRSVIKPKLVQPVRR